jgi:hypothetical protein
VNICNDGGSVVTFTDPRLPKDEEFFEAPRYATAEWLDYCRTREADERAAAKKAASIEARRVHQELAQAYARRATEPVPLARVAISPTISQPNVSIASNKA